MFIPHFVETQNLVGITAYGIALIFLQTSDYTGSSLASGIRIRIIVITGPAEIIDRVKSQPVRNPDIKIKVSTELIGLVVCMVTIAQVVQVVG